MHVTWIISPLPYIGLATGFGGNAVLSNILGLIYIFGILLSVIGGVSVLKRRTLGLALIGSLGAVICVPLLGIATIILTVRSKNRFAGQST